MDKVFVVHGRDVRLARSLFGFLRAIGVQPIEWTQAVALTDDASPFIGQVLDTALAAAKAVVVLFTGDDLAQLSDHLRASTDADYDSLPTPQARPNVLFEAGLAFGRHPKQTVLVEIGRLRPFSDIAGRHVIRLDNSTQMRQELARRLASAGCTIDLSGTDWHTVGDFSTAPQLALPSSNKKPIAIGGFVFRDAYLMFGNHTSPIHVESVYEHKVLTIPEDIKPVYSFLADQAKLAAEDLGAQYFNGPNTRIIRFVETSNQAASGYEEKRIRLHLGPVAWEEFTVLNTNLDHVLLTGRTIRETYATNETLYAHDRDLRWCKLSNILSVGVVPITSDGYGLVQTRNPRGVSSEGGRYTSGIAENIHRYLDEVNSEHPTQRLHEVALPSEVHNLGIDHTYAPQPGNTLSPYLTAQRGLWEEISEGLHDLIPPESYKFLNVTFELTKFHPTLGGVVHLDRPWSVVQQMIAESPGRDHSEFLAITAVPLDPKHVTTTEVLAKSWVPGGLAAFVSAMHYWKALNS